MKTAFTLCLAAGLFFGFIPSVFALGATPQTYTFSARSMMSPGLTLQYRVYRDGVRERIEVSLDDGTAISTTVFDFQAHKFFALRSAEAGGCETGRYLSPRAPVDRDSFTAGTEMLPKTQRKVIRSETVHGIPARLEEFAPEKPSGKPIRVWFAKSGNFVVKMEGKAEDGKPIVMYEITKWSAKKPPAALLTPPENCVMTDSQMNDSPSIRAHGEAEVKASSTVKVDLGKK